MCGPERKGPRLLSSTSAATETAALQSASEWYVPALTCDSFQWVYVAQPYMETAPYD
jgi:hypothetical protein